MPFASKSQQRFMFAKHPRIAKRWAHKMKRKGQSIKALPEKVATVLTTETRGALSEKDFALPGRRYPIHDEAHARSALVYGERHATPAEKAIIRRKVMARYPGMRVTLPKKGLGGKVDSSRPGRVRLPHKRKKAILAKLSEVISG